MSENYTVSVLSGSLEVCLSSHGLSHTRGIFRTKKVAVSLRQLRRALAIFDRSIKIAIPCKSAQQQTRSRFPTPHPPIIVVSYRTGCPPVPQGECRAVFIYRSFVQEGCPCLHRPIDPQMHHQGVDRIVLSQSFPSQFCSL